MPRPKHHTLHTLPTAALGQFWAHGYQATSMGDLVKATGASRHGLYADFAGKHALFLACFDIYQETIVTPAFARVEAAGATMADVQTYYMQQIDLADVTGLPGVGCFVANAATEVAPHDTAVMAKVEEHNLRLQRGFQNALRGGTSLPKAEIQPLAATMVIFTNGLWSSARHTTGAQQLRDAVRCFLNIIPNRTPS